MIDSQAADPTILRWFPAPWQLDAGGDLTERQRDADLQAITTARRRHR